jgi:uncharacterized protein (TIGR02598 family)
MKTNREELKVKGEELDRVSGGRRRHFPACKLLTSSRGFSLVEVMIAIGIVAFAVVGILTAFPVGIKAGQDARDENTAAFIADNVFAQIRSQPFSTAGANLNLKVPQSPTYYTLNLGNNSSYSGNSQIDSGFYYFDVNGAPANAASGGAQGSKILGSGYKGDQAYFAVRIYRIHVNPYYVPATPGQNVTTDPTMGYDPVYNDYMTSLAYVGIEVSWPAQVPYNNRVTGHIRVFHSAIANLH